MPDPLRPLLIGDTLVRFANGMVYVFFVLVVTRIFSVGLERTVAVGGISYAVDLSPQPFFFGYLLGVEMVVALITMVPAAKLAERVGLKPIVALGFFVYGVFPLVLVFGPDLLSPFVSIQWALVLVFAFSGLRFAGLPSHKALIVGPAEQGRRRPGHRDLLPAAKHDRHPERRDRRLPLGLRQSGGRLHRRRRDRRRRDRLLPRLRRGVRGVRPGSVRILIGYGSRCCSSSVAIQYLNARE